jgi:hypothetical protein
MLGPLWKPFREKAVLFVHRSVPKEKMTVLTSSFLGIADKSWCFFPLGPPPCHKKFDFFKCAANMRSLQDSVHAFKKSCLERSHILI